MATTMAPTGQSKMWEVTARTVVYAAIGAALYAVAAQFSFLLPGTANVSLRPGFALVTFFGFIGGPWAGFFAGFVGNAFADQISGWGLLTSWNWSLANGAVGLLVGVMAAGMLGSMNRIAQAAIASAIAIVIGFLIVFSDIWLGTADNFDEALTANYIPVVVANLIVAVILTPILVAAWEPIREQMGR